MIQFMRFRNVFHLTLLVVLLLSAAGCENKSSQETSASLTDDDFVILASLAEGETGLGQTAVEIIPVPKISSQRFHDMDREAATSMPAAAALEAMENEALVVTPPTGEDLTFEEKVQISLRNAGFYEGEIDGRVGSQTRSSIKAFQRVNGLKEDGMTGPSTWAKLREYYSPDFGSSVE